MYAQVKCLKGFSAELTYKVPISLEKVIHVGAIVTVPLRNAQTNALVIQLLKQRPKNTRFTIKEIISIARLPHDEKYQAFITSLAQQYQIEPLHFYQRLHQYFHEPKRTVKQPEIPVDNAHLEIINLTQEQKEIVSFAKPYITKPNYTPTLLHGVTGSGKTECYKKLIEHAIAHNKSVILLLPEVTLALQFENILRTQLPTTIATYSFHSATSQRDKKIVWQRLLKQQPTLIVGVHQPILLPIANLGLIIIDEEHETGYQEKKHPKINSKNAALWRAYQYNIPIVLGSATPSVQSLYNVKHRDWHFFQLTKRFAGNFPTVKVVQLTENKDNRKNFWVSKELQTAIADRLHKKEQTIVFLNRRGFSFFVQCKQCSFVFSCDNCSVSLTLHQNNILACHYCGFCLKLPHKCSECKAPEKEFLKKGVGTQQVVTILQKLFPSATIARADMDTTIKRKNWQETVKQFSEGTIDILVGTQTITKGYHFPNVTLVGILWADLNLHFPVYNATETTLQQLIQVAGRAGRATNNSTVIVQTMINHPVFAYVNEQNYVQFYDVESEKRKMLSYPPYARLVEIELKHENEETVEREAQTIAQKLTNNTNKIITLGPSKPAVHKIKKTHTRKIYLKGNNLNLMQQLYSQVASANYKSRIFFTPNPSC